MITGEGGGGNKRAALGPWVSGATQPRRGTQAGHLQQVHEGLGRFEPQEVLTWICQVVIKKKRLAV